jgi:hypothetical protein
MCSSTNFIVIKLLTRNVIYVYDVVESIFVFFNTSCSSGTLLTLSYSTGRCLFILVGIKCHYVEERNRNLDSPDNETNVGGGLPASTLCFDGTPYLSKWSDIYCLIYPLRCNWIYFMFFKIFFIKSNFFKKILF